jgi:lipid II:glycine glycyltransferase (peptidoglycan interpeptide bridge formation enzyme)
LLASRFPENIVLHSAFLGEEMVAGVVMYLANQVAHAQYIASNEQGRELGALDLVFQTLITETYHGWSCFDFGISTEQAGRVLNVGLIAQKEGFGARAVMYDQYLWPLSTAQGKRSY